nr:pyridoxal phosphate-dependent aminotransferase [Anaeromonas gelatinilytica]
MCGYTATSGYPSLTYGIQLYEQVLCSESVEPNEKICKHISVTSGATAAINYLFSYLAAKHCCRKVLLLGLNYYLFKVCAVRFGFDIETLMNSNKDTIAPSVEEVRSSIKMMENQVVVLTLPFNPSGEIYSYQELVEIIVSCKENNSLLVIDKCQMDELASEYEFVNICKAILEAKAEEEVIIINSFSKTRSLAGARLGYIFSNNNELIEYVSYLNEVNYYNHGLMYENAVLIDLFFRLLHYKGFQYKKKLIRQFRNIILLTMGNSEYQKIYKPIFKTEKLDLLMEDFKNEVSSNSEIVFKNYKYCKEELNEYLLSITELKSGYNFCIRIPIDINLDEIDFCNKITESLKMTVLSQSYFCGEDIDMCNSVWIRVSAAVKEEVFQSYIDNLKITLRSVYEDD